jgi:hypothetical protein
MSIKVTCWRRRCQREQSKWRQKKNRSEKSIIRLGENQPIWPLSWLLAQRTFWVEIKITQISEMISMTIETTDGKKI